MFFHIKGPLEVHDHRRGPPHEEPPLQVDADPEHVLHVQQPSAAHRNAAAKQTAGTLGAAQLFAAIDLPRLQHLRAVVQRAVRCYRRKGEEYNLTNKLIFLNKI
jgi:hypothetical protein